MTVPSRRTVPAQLQIDAILSHLDGRQALEEVCRFLNASFPHYAWVGIYRTEGAELALVAWDGRGPTEHTRIPISRGICGRAAREGRSVIVDDVRSSTEYLACFLETRAEIVVPIRGEGAVLGEIDIDGNEVGAYDDSDRRFLEAVAAKLTSALEGISSEPPA